jgi:hypothetical protein
MPHSAAHQATKPAATANNSCGNQMLLLLLLKKKKSNCWRGARPEAGKSHCGVKATATSLSLQAAHASASKGTHSVQAAS